MTLPPQHSTLKTSVTPYVHLFFMDGVGLGGSDPTVNPFVTAHMPRLAGLLGASWYLGSNGVAPAQPFAYGRATLVPTDATLGVPGRPQSATGQATILTGRNVPQLVGEHYGPKPNHAVASIIKEGTLFHEVLASGQRAALITPYPQRYFDAINSGRRLLSAVPLAATSAGLPLMTADDLRNGDAVSPGFTGQAWRDQLGYNDIPVLSRYEAGQRIATIARSYHFTFFEHWPSDLTGHRGTLNQAVEHLEMIDEVLGGLFDNWDDQAGLLIITSDHGNIEEKNHRQHTLNPVPTILMGLGHAELARQIRNLADIAKIVRRVLSLPG